MLNNKINIQKFNFLHIFVYFFLIQSQLKADDIRFLDVTSKRYSGDESALIGFGISDMELRQDRIYSTKQFFRWESKIRRQAKQENSYPLLKSFIVNFEIKDRKGNITQKETGKYTSQTYTSKAGKVAKTPDGGFILVLSKNFEVAYPEITYWFSDIEWEEHEIVQPKSDRVAFTLKDQFDSIRKKDKEKKEMEKELIFSFTRPSSYIDSFNIDDYEGYIIKGEEQLKQVNLSESSIKIIPNICKRVSCSHDEINANKNRLHNDIRESCAKYGCILLYSKNKPYMPPKWRSPFYPEGFKNPCESSFKIKTEACSGGGTIFSAERCLNLSHSCQRIVPYSLDMQIQQESETLLVLFTNVHGKAEIDRIKYKIEDRLIKIELK